MDNKMIIDEVVRLYFNTGNLGKAMVELKKIIKHERYGEILEGIKKIRSEI